MEEDDLFTDEELPGGLPDDSEIESYTAGHIDGIEQELQEAIETGELYDFQYSHGVKTRCRVRNKYSDHVRARSSHKHREKHHLHLITADPETAKTYPEEAEVETLYAGKSSPLLDSIEERNKETTILDVEIGMGYRDKSQKNYALLIELPD
ncbi:MAG: hypothetical protein SVU32_08900 [Candidatus Nanohaloarchaea archaeon]|nr:hypothetical protein [Candidatus Nanohaloarchaea archaeon]